ncbi:hypothetical protein X975_20517, partial [Stegodyphus mimosarum]
MSLALASSIFFIIDIANFMKRITAPYLILCIALKILKILFNTILFHNPSTKMLLKPNQTQSHSANRINNATTTYVSACAQSVQVVQLF